MRKDITIEKMKLGGEKVNKSELARRYNCCWETIDRRFNPEKYKKDKKKRTYVSILDPYKCIIDAKLEIELEKTILDDDAQEVLEEKLMDNDEILEDVVDTNTIDETK